MSLLGYHGDLGMDDGVPQSVFDAARDRRMGRNNPRAKDGDVVFGAMLRKAGIRFEELC